LVRRSFPPDPSPAWHEWDTFQTGFKTKSNFFDLCSSPLTASAPLFLPFSRPYGTCFLGMARAYFHPPPLPFSSSPPPLLPPTCGNCPSREIFSVAYLCLARRGPLSFRRFSFFPFSLRVLAFGGGVCVFLLPPCERRTPTSSPPVFLFRSSAPTEETHPGIVPPSGVYLSFYSLLLRHFSCLKGINSFDILSTSSPTTTGRPPLRPDILGPGCLALSARFFPPNLGFFFLGDKFWRAGFAFFVLHSEDWRIPV